MSGRRPSRSVRRPVLAAHSLGRERYGLDDLGVARATAEIAGDGIDDFIAGRLRIFQKQGMRGEDHRRRAVTFSRAVVGITTRLWIQLSLHKRNPGFSLSCRTWPSHCRESAPRSPKVRGVGRVRGESPQRPVPGPLPRSWFCPHRLLPAFLRSRPQRIDSPSI